MSLKAEVGRRKAEVACRSLELGEEVQLPDKTGQGSGIRRAGPFKSKAEVGRRKAELA